MKDKQKLNADEYIVPALIITNLAAGFGCAIPIAHGLRKVTGQTEKSFRYFAMFVGVYFVECVAFAAGMCTQVLTVALGFVWGVIFGLRLRNIAPAKEVLKTVIFVSLYGCLPTCSFAVILSCAWVISGNSLLNVEQAYSFGIPQFVPWPFNTVLGFCAGLATGTILLKTAITTGIVGILIRRGQNPAAANHI
ncbi:MAG TPA: hypothetical protein VJJ98_05525 [Sedimentisphaerales bacterium]|nr:hypothetical protein [Sedimentisphaerales bacterium]